MNCYQQKDCWIEVVDLSYNWLVDKKLVVLILEEDLVVEHKLVVNHELELAELLKVEKKRYDLLECKEEEVVEILVILRCLH